MAAVISCFKINAFTISQVDDVVIISGSPGLLTSAEREARSEHDDRLVEELTSQGVAAFVDTWYEAPMWKRLGIWFVG